MYLCHRFIFQIPFFLIIGIWLVLHFCLAAAAPRHPEFQGCPFTAKNGATVYDFAGDVYELVGQAVSLDCKLSHNATGDSGNLMWMYNQTEIPDENVERVDDQTLRLNLVNVTVDSSGPYRCRLRDSARGVCFAKIKVGYPPLQVENFTCISTNWKYLVCSWVAPYNPIKTTYNLVLNDGIADRKRCLIKTMPKEPSLQFCNFSDDTEIPYPMYRPHLKFRFTASNKFGASSFEFHVDHFTRVIPNSPVDVSAVSESSRTMRVIWQLPSNLKRFPPGFLCRVSYKSEYSRGLNYTTILLDKNVFSVNLTSMIPYSKYSIGVGCISSVADASDNTMWSAPTYTETQTLCDVPENPPSVAPGSFHVRQYINNRTVVIYWKSIGKELWNGRDLHYLATARMFGQEGLWGPVVANNGTAEFKNLSLNDGYEFSVWAANEVGKSVEKATVVVEATWKLPREPSTLMVVAYDAALFEVSWTPPLQSLHAEDKIDGYTVFWSESYDRFERNPQGNLNWQRVDSSTHHLNVTVDGTKPFYHFGVSSNSKTMAGSLIWNTCIMSYNGTIGKLKKVSVVRATSSAIHVSWSLDCSEKLGIISGYKLYYCPAEKEYFHNCTGEVHDIYIDGINVNSYDIISNVKPFLMYKIVVSAITKAGEGEHSDAQFIRTGEAIPSAVQNVHVLDVRNSSFLVSWNPPSSSNGVILRYNVFYSSSATGERRNIYEFSTDSLHRDSLPVLQDANLVCQLNVTDYVLPYANYTVSVEACTIAGCSHRSVPITVITEVGVPGRMYPPIARLYNSTCVLVEPEVGYDVNGPGDFWELRVISVDENAESNSNDTTSDFVSVWKFNASDNMVYLPVHCDSTDIDLSVLLQSRLINIKNGELLFGQWSDYVKSNGYCIIGPSASLIIGGVVGSTLALTVILLIAIFATKRAKVVWYKVQNLNVKLPDGLDPTKDLPSFANGQMMTPKMNSYANLGTIYGPALIKPLIDDQRLRNDSGGTNQSSCSTDGLVLRDYGASSKNAWSANDSSLASINQESVSSLPSTIQTHLSSDSSMEFNSSVPESPDSVFGHNVEHPLKPALIPVPSPHLLPQHNISQSGFNPTLMTIGEALDNCSSRDATPRHYSKFTSYLDPQNVSTTSLKNNKYVAAAPYSKFSTNQSMPQSYSKFGSAASSNTNFDDDTYNDEVLAPPNKVETACNLHNNVGYSVFGYADEQSPFQSIANSPSKGYVMPGCMLVNDVSHMEPRGIKDGFNDNGDGGDEEVVVDTDELNFSYLDMAAHKGSLSNPSMSTPGYSRLGLSRPTSTRLDSDQYVQPDPPTSSPTKGGGGGGSITSTPHNNCVDGSVDLTTASSSCDPKVALKLQNGYTSVNGLVDDT